MWDPLGLGCEPVSGHHLLPNFASSVVNSNTDENSSHSLPIVVIQ